ncbi:MAG: hypothetical protein QOK25_309 [Thermoleophilaceae bacterium]|nr:hypothetical protein [Thermoleophilaceae bacterium]
MRAVTRRETGERIGRASGPRPWLAWGLVAVATGLAAAIFAEQFRLHLVSDLPAHVRIGSISIRTGEFPGDALYYLVLAAVTGLSTSVETLEAAAVALLALAVGAKLAISIRIAFIELAPDLGAAPAARRHVLAGGIPVALFLLVFAFSLPTDTPYLGQLPPNIWHNSTTIFLMPFALALFWCSLQFLRTAETRWLWWSAAAVGLNVLAKPSLVLAFLLAFPVAAVRRFGWRQPALRGAALLVAASAALLAAQYVYVYAADPAVAHLFGADARPSHVGVAPFRVWGRLSDDVPLSLLASLAFPLVAGVVYRRRLLDSDMVRYAVALASAGIVLFALLEETGPRLLHGNFAWQATVADYLLFLAVTIQVARLWSRRQRLGGGDLAVAVAFLAHVAAGIWFLYRWRHTGTYV